MSSGCSRCCVSGDTVASYIQQWEDACKFVDQLTEGIAMELQSKSPYEIVDFEQTIKLLKRQMVVLDEVYAKAELTHKKQMTPICGYTPLQFKSIVSFTLTMGTSIAGLAAQAANAKNTKEGKCESDQMTWAAFGCTALATVLAGITARFGQEWKEWEKTRDRVDGILKNKQIINTTRALIEIHEDARLVSPITKSRGQPSMHHLSGEEEERALPPSNRNAYPSRGDALEEEKDSPDKQGRSLPEDPHSGRRHHHRQHQQEREKDYIRRFLAIKNMRYSDPYTETSRSSESVQNLKKHKILRLSPEDYAALDLAMATPPLAAGTSSIADLEGQVSPLSIGKKRNSPPDSRRGVLEHRPIEMQPPPPLSVERATSGSDHIITILPKTPKGAVAAAGDAEIIPPLPLSRRNTSSDPTSKGKSHSPDEVTV